MSFIPVMARLNFQYHYQVIITFRSQSKMLNWCSLLFLYNYYYLSLINKKFKRNIFCNILMA